MVSGGLRLLGETDLGKLMAGMEAVLFPDIFVFATVDVVPKGLLPRMLFKEPEGTTLILRQNEADAHAIPYEFPCRMITLSVHSSLNAVGFIAGIATELAKAEVPVNPVSGYFHDHIFVPLERADDAMSVLARLAQQGQ